MKNFLTVVVINSFLFSCFVYAEAPDYYKQADMSNRLSYVNYDALMNECMRPLVGTGTVEGSSVWNAFLTVCNKKLDQVKYPETFEGKIPHEQNLYTQKGLGVEVMEYILK
jgi:hypothetical protein